MAMGALVGLLMMGAIAVVITFTFTGVAIYQATLTADFCQRLCASPPSATPQLDQTSVLQCQQGCSFPKIDTKIKRLYDRLVYLNTTRDQCYGLCTEAYDDNGKVNCFRGCSKIIKFQKAIWLYLEQGEVENVLEVEVSLVSDPALWKQNSEFFNVYKLPQTFIRTMPIQPEIAEDIDGKNWSPCTTQRADIPLWIVALIAVALTIFTLYVSFILPSRNDEDNIYRNLSQEDMYEGDDLRKELDMLYRGNGEKKDPAADNIVVDLNLMTLNEFLTEDYHANVIPPPKYTLLPVAKERSDA
ncbi:uncharacterized protein LOC143915743 isoform X2 [Arctopsyche grandis]|uniref:uncharacterized protein LOC143915743 isoform X2 n=1 Tax=Arctopsyche grandis TaxID=121162 RepID=UPI00406D9D75